MASQRLSAPGDALEAGRANARCGFGALPLPFPTITACSQTHWLGPRRHAKQQHLSQCPDMIGEPAAIAGVQGRHCLTEPVPLVGTGCSRGTRTRHAQQKL